MEHAGLVYAAVGVGTEEVTLGLGQSGRQALGAQEIYNRFSVVFLGIYIFYLGIKIR